MKAIDRLIAVLDFSTMEEAKKMVETLGDSVKLYKVGLELFLNSKGEAVDYLKNLGKEVFFSKIIPTLSTICLHESTKKSLVSFFVFFKVRLNFFFRTWK